MATVVIRMQPNMKLQLVNQTHLELMGNVIALQLLVHRISIVLKVQEAPPMPFQSILEPMELLQVRSLKMTSQSALLVSGVPRDHLSKKIVLVATIALLELSFSMSIHAQQALAHQLETTLQTLQAVQVVLQENTVLKALKQALKRHVLLEATVNLVHCLEKLVIQVREHQEPISLKNQNA
jgi:hypothetical protein